MDFNNIAIGTDIEEISRFKEKTEEDNSLFLKRIFTQKELEYCFKNKNFAQHLCGRFCAKEAVVKALTEFEITNITISDIEIINDKFGKPIVNISKYPDIKIKLSISHCKTHATAVAIAFRPSDNI